MVNGVGQGAARDLLIGKFAVAIVVVGVAGSVASANPGAAGWSVITHMVFGVWIIGLIESFIANLFGARPRVYILVTLANVGSAFVGVWLATSLFQVFMHQHQSDPLDHIVPASWMSFAVLALMGPIIEFPLFLLSWRRPWWPPGKTWRRPIVAVLVGSIVTNALLVWHYSGTWVDSLVTEYEQAPAASVAAPAVVNEEIPWVYFIAHDERTIRRVRLDGSVAEVVARSDRDLDERELRAVRQENGEVDLVVHAWNEKSPRLIMRDPDEEIIGNRQPLEDSSYSRTVVERVGLTYTDFGSEGQQWMVADLRPMGARPTKLKAHWDGVKGVTVERVSDGSTSSIAIDNGFAHRAYAPFNVSVLPGEVIVFQLNHEWDVHPSGIYIVGIDSGTRAWIAAGRSPVAVYECGVPGWEPE